MSQDSCLEILGDLGLLEQVASEQGKISLGGCMQERMGMLNRGHAQRQGG